MQSHSLTLCTHTDTHTDTNTHTHVIPLHCWSCFNTPQSKVQGFPSCLPPAPGVCLSQCIQPKGAPAKTAAGRTLESIVPFRPCLGFISLSSAVCSKTQQASEGRIWERKSLQKFLPLFKITGLLRLPNLISQHSLNKKEILGTERASELSKFQVQ